MKYKFTAPMKVFLLMLMVFTTIGTHAQQKKKKATLGIYSVKATNPENYKEAASLTSSIKEAYVTSKRYTPLDRSSFSETSKIKEKDVQKNIDFINGYIAKQGKQQGAKYLVVSELTGVEYSKKEQGFNCSLNFNISITDIESGELISTKAFQSPKDLSGVDGSDKVTALSSEIRSFKNKIANFIIESTPFFAKVVDFERDGKKTYITLDVGNPQGVRSGDRYVVIHRQVKPYGIKDVEITKFGVKAVQGDFSIARVAKSDVKVLEELFNNPEAEILCKQIPCTICLPRFK